MSDVLIQTQNKSYVPRIIEYYDKYVFCSREARKPFPRYAELGESGESKSSPPSTSASSSSSSTSLPPRSSSPLSPAPPLSPTSSSSSTSLHGRLGTSAVELSRGCRGGRGPGLVLIKGVLASPEELIEWIRWRSPLPRAVARVYWLGREEEERGRTKSPSGSDGGDGAFATFSASTSAELAREILSRLSPPPPPETPVRIMAVPKSLQISLIDALAGAGWPLEPRAAAAGAATGRGLFVVAAALDGLDISDEAERTRHDPPPPSPRYRAALVRASAVLADTTEQRQVGERACRAEWKLSEALAGRLDELSGSGGGEGEREGGREGRGIRALDVGASPGGWSRFLALTLGAARVVALDPAALDDDVAALPNVTHLRVLSHAPGALEAARAALCAGLGGEGGEGAEREGGRERRRRQPANLLTCDANDTPAKAARCILPLLPLLRPGALVVLTLKLRYPGKDKDFATKAAMEELGGPGPAAAGGGGGGGAGAGLELLESRWLMANTMCERTLVLRKKG